MYSTALNKIAFINFHNTTKCKDLCKKFDDQTKVLMFIFIQKTKHFDAYHSF